MNERVVLILLLLCGVFPTAQAETEGFAYACESSTCFWRRPIVDPPPGWVRDDEAGAHFKFNAFAKTGEDFAAAPAVLYANAVYRRNAAPTLADQIAADKERILKSSPRSKISEAPSTQNADGKRLATFMFTPEKDDEGWETVAYDEEGDYYLRFVLSSQTKQAHDEALAAFEAFVRGYSRTPGKAPR
jgi:hypothetical protein